LRSPRWNERLAALGVALRVGQRQGGTPGTAGDDPAFDSQVLTQPLDVGHEVPGGVVAEFTCGCRPPCAALVEHHEAVCLRVVDGTHRGLDARPRPAVQIHHRLAGRAAGLLVVHRVQFVQRQRTDGVGRTHGVARRRRL
jgi:hypothetical protein